MGEGKAVVFVLAMLAGMGLFHHLRGRAPSLRMTTTTWIAALATRLTLPVNKVALALACH